MGTIIIKYFIVTNAACNITKSKPRAALQLKLTIQTNEQ